MLKLSSLLLFAALLPIVKCKCHPPFPDFMGEQRDACCGDGKSCCSLSGANKRGANIGENFHEQMDFIQYLLKCCAVGSHSLFDFTANNYSALKFSEPERNRCCGPHFELPPGDYTVAKETCCNNWGDCVCGFPPTSFDTEPNKDAIMNSYYDFSYACSLEKGKEQCCNDATLLPSPVESTQGGGITDAESTAVEQPASTEPAVIIESTFDGGITVAERTTVVEEGSTEPDVVVPSP